MLNGQNEAKPEAIRDFSGTDAGEFESYLMREVGQGFRDIRALPSWKTLQLALFSYKRRQFGFASLNVRPFFPTTLSKSIQQLPEEEEGGSHGPKN